MLNIDYHVFAIVAGFIVLDVLTGFTQAVVNKTVDSSVMRLGLWHKSAYVMAIILALLCEYATIYMELGFTLPITLPICAFICMTEIVSIIENLGKTNPELLNNNFLNFFSQARTRRKDDNGKDDK